MLIFQKWTEEYFFVSMSFKVSCVISNESIVVFEGYNIHIYYDSNQKITKTMPVLWEEEKMMFSKGDSSHKRVYSENNTAIVPGHYEKFIVLLSCRL